MLFVAAGLQFYVDAFANGFIIAFSVVIFPIFYLYRERSIFKLCMITSIFSPFFRGLVLTFHGASFVWLWQRCIRSVFSIFRTVLFFISDTISGSWTVEQKIFIGWRPLFLHVIFSRTLLNFPCERELTVWFMRMWYYLLTVAMLRTVLVIILIVIINSSENFLLQKENRRRYEQLVMMNWYV